MSNLDIGFVIYNGESKMKDYVRLLMTAIFVLVQGIFPVAHAADTAVASLSISGNTPVIFNVSARGYPGDLDLMGNTSVASDRMIGTFHFKYNVGVASMTLKSTQVAGVPSTGTAANTAYTFNTAFSLKFSACTSIAAAYEAAWAPTVGTPAIDLGAGIDIKDAAATSAAALVTLGHGIEEDCDLTATWGAANAAIPLAGKYYLDLTLTMISI